MAMAMATTHVLLGLSPFSPISAAISQKPLVFLLLVTFCIVALSGVVWSLGDYYQLVTLISPSSSKISDKPRTGNGNSKNYKPTLPSDELSDFHVYNTTKTWPRPHFHVLVDARRHQKDPENLCRTLLSAVVQGHPPPILVGYRAENGGNDNNEGLKNNQVSSTELFLNATLDAIRFTKIQQRPSDEEGPYEKERDDVILFLGQNQWIQMPAEVTVRRFLQHKEVLSQRLKREYGLSSSPLPGSSFGIDFTLEGETQTRHNNSTYKLGVLFPASRRKSRLTSQGHKIEKKEQEIDESESHTSSHEGSNIEDQDDILPESSLPEDVYGVFPDAGKSVTSWWRKMGHGNSKMAIPTRYQRPRYLGGRSFMGEVEDVERLLRGAVERVGWLGGDDGTREENLDEGGDELTYLFSEMFFEQEIERRRQQEVALRRQGEDIMRQGEQKGWWSGLWGGNETSNMMNDSDDEEAGDNPDEYEFGITLDYESRIFQDMASYPDLFNTTTHKTSDIRFLSFTRPNLVHSPSRTAAHLYSDPLRLPPELLHPLSPGGRSSPFGLTTTRYNLSEILKAVSHAIDEKLPRGENTASEITMIHWPNLQFATNLVVPRGSVPSILDMARVSSSSGPDSETQTEEKVDSGEIDKYWARMWFQQKQDHNTREQRYTPVKDLLDEYLHPNRYIYALEAAGGGRNWWNMRGGRGGLWTDQGGWIPWSQICGALKLD